MTWQLLEETRAKSRFGVSTSQTNYTRSDGGERRFFNWRIRVGVSGGNCVPRAKPSHRSAFSGRETRRGRPARTGRPQASRLVIVFCKRGVRSCIPHPQFLPDPRNKYYSKRFPPSRYNCKQGERIFWLQPSFLLWFDDYWLPPPKSLWIFSILFKWPCSVGRIFAANRLTSGSCEPSAAFSNAATSSLWSSTVILI